MLTTSCFVHLRNISKLRSAVLTAELEMFIRASVSPRSDYCNALFSALSISALHCLQTIQNAAAIFFSHTTLILKCLQWLPAAYRIQFKILTLTYRALHGQTAAYVADSLRPYSPTCSHCFNLSALALRPMMIKFLRS